MATITINGPFADTMPETQAPIFADIRANWTDNWWTDLGLEFVSGRWCSAADGIEQAVLQRTYGWVMDPWDNDFSERAPCDYTGYWIRLKLGYPGGDSVFFVGKISPDTRDVQGSSPVSTGNLSRGVQTLTAYGPQWLLNRIGMSKSRWFVESWAGDVESEVDWMPRMNDRDGFGQLKGNRTTQRYTDGVQDDTGGVYLYGGKAVWNHREKLEYLVRHYLDESATGGPSWKLAGDLEVLERLEETIDFGRVDTLGGMLRKLIPKDRGLDFVVQPYWDDAGDGFQIVVFCLLGKSYSFGESMLPSNPNSFDFATSGSPMFPAVKLERNQDHLYGRLRVLGNRVLCCCSLYGQHALNSYPPYDATLTAKWPADLQAEYKSPISGSTSAEEQDAARRDERLKQVWQHYAAPAAWNLNELSCAPKLDNFGEIVSNEAAPYQLTVRSTETWLPLRYGWDYSYDPPDDNNPAGSDPDFIKPAVWFPGNEITQEDAEGNDTSYTPYVPAEDLGITVAVSKTDWGVHLTCDPQHKLAESEPPEYTATPPDADYRDGIATIAFYTDERLGIELATEDASASDGVLDIDAGWAEYWYLAPNTVIALDTEGQPVLSGTEPRVLRSDYEQLTMVMAGALARYQSSRCKAHLTMRGMWPVQNLVGMIFNQLNEGDDQTAVAGPVTSCSWSGGDTILATGYVSSRPRWEDRFAGKRQAYGEARPASERYEPQPPAGGARVESTITPPAGGGRVESNIGEG